MSNILEKMNINTVLEKLDLQFSKNIFALLLYTNLITKYPPTIKLMIIIPDITVNTFIILC